MSKTQQCTLFCFCSRPKPPKSNSTRHKKEGESNQKNKNKLELTAPLYNKTRGVARRAQHETGVIHLFCPVVLLNRALSYLGHLGQASGVGVLVEKDLVSHFLPDLSLGPLLLSPGLTSGQDTQRQKGQTKEKGRRRTERDRERESSVRIQADMQTYVRVVSPSQICVWLARVLLAVRRTTKRITVFSTNGRRRWNTGHRFHLTQHKNIARDVPINSR